MNFHKLALLAGISGIAFSTVAYAQESAGTAAPKKAEVESVAEVVVTGSRIVSNGNAMPTPVTVVTTDTLLRTSPANIPDGLKKLPAFALSRGVANLNNPTDNFTGNYLNLRGFGIQRNLILMDGHRLAPTSYTGAVDTNVLPQMLMQRVDVVTGGASAVYGSDAVSGVVNFILDNKFKGLKVEGQSGISGHGDAFSWKAGLAFGTDVLGGRGHIEGSFEHFTQDGIQNKFDRPQGAAVYAVAGNGTAAVPFRLITNARATTLSFKGSILTGPFAGDVFNAAGQPVPFTHGIVQGPSLESGGDGFFGDYSAMTADLTTNQGFGRFDYDLTENVKFYAQGIWAQAHNFNNFYPNLIFPHVIAGDNAFIPASMQGAGPFLFDKVWDSPTGVLGVDAKAENYLISTGLDANFAGYNWKFFYEHGQSTTTNSQFNDTKQGNLDAALDAVDQGRFLTGTANGNIVCRVTITNPSAFPGCVPLNPFGTTAESQAAALKYYLGNSYNRPQFTLDNVEGSVSGTVFNNWAGPVQMAVSGDYRNQALRVTTNSLATDFVNCAGIELNCAPGTPTFRAGGITPISKSESVSEAAVEVEFPLLKDSPFAKSLSINGAARYTNYSVSGSATTWKIGGDWEINDSFRIRGTRSRDIRAPSLNELYQPATAAQSGYQDVHTGQGGVVATLTTGNPNLVPEVAQVLTVGGVFTPSSVRGLSMSIDYYNIDMSNAIASIDGRTSSIQQVCEASGGTSNFCTLYVRPLPFSNTTPANAPTLVKIQQLNASSVKTWGIDGEINYGFNAAGGRVSLRGLVGYQPELTTLLAPGLPAQIGAGAAASQGVGGVPVWRLTGFASYSNDLFSVDVQERWRSSLGWDSNPAVIYAIPRIAAVAYTDLTLTANIGADRNKQVFLSISNLFDQQPPIYLTSGTSGTPAFSFPAVVGDDIVGRYFTLGARMRF
jgi:outer membrane receptor protein involved in Fe transport